MKEDGKIGGIHILIHRSNDSFLTGTNPISRSYSITNIPKNIIISHFYYLLIVIQHIEEVSQIVNPRRCSSMNLQLVAEFCKWQVNGIGCTNMT